MEDEFAKCMLSSELTTGILFNVNLKALHVISIATGVQFHTERELMWFINACLHHQLPISNLYMSGKLNSMSLSYLVIYSCSCSCCRVGGPVLLILVDQESATQEQRTITSKLRPQMSWMMMISTSSARLR